MSPRRYVIAGFFLLSYATDVAGMTLAIGVMRVSVVIPFLASWLVWHETPSFAQGIGLSLAGVAFFLIAHRHRNPKQAIGEDASEPDRSFGSGAFRAIDWHAFVVLALTFCVGGAVDLSMKAFEESLGARNSQVLFLLLAFGMAMLIGTVVVVFRGLRFGRWPRGKSLRWGILLGVVNYGSLEFLLRAIADLPGPFVFPANNIAIMVLSAGIGVYVWSERLTLPNRVGISIAIIALVLLRL